MKHALLIDILKHSTTYLCGMSKRKSKPIPWYRIHSKRGTIYAKSSKLYAWKSRKTIDPITNFHPCFFCETKKIFDFINFRQNWVLDFRYEVTACDSYILSFIIKKYNIQHSYTSPIHYENKTYETHTLHSVLIYYKYYIKDTNQFFILYIKDIYS